MLGYKFLNLLRFDVENFDKNINFDLWQVQVRNLLIQCELQKVLGRDSIKGSMKDSDKSSMSDEDCEGQRFYKRI